jgi:hypothetical protein
MKYKECVMCPKPVVWVRCTQFAGDHPFCEECAKKEEDFGEDDPSYFYWVKVERITDSAG